jgi:VIT1/CCC1 family predicted Fe2+/Mn2+ transporter
MAASNYLGTKTEKEEYAQIKAFEQHQIDAEPVGEVEEVREILKRKGFSDEPLERAVQLIVSDREQWVRLMLSEEYGLPLVLRSPIKAALATFGAFFVCGAIPLLPYFIASAPLVIFPAGITVFAFFLIGAFKSKWSLVSWWYSGLQTTAVGTAAAALAFIVGYGFRALGG